MEIKFKRDTGFRKQFFVPDSFAHPAKMDAQLLIWIVEKYTEAGETILDPMAGSGTMMLACGLGRNCILVELEDKFCKMMRDNWEKVSKQPQLGYSMGNCQIIQGDARNLTGLVDKCIFSPPYAEDTHHTDDTQDTEKYRPHRSSRVSGTAGESENNIGQLPYGSIDKIVTSPPYSENPGTPSLGSVNKDDWGKAGKDIVARRGLERGYSKDTDGQRGNLPYGNIDAVVTSPPYEGGNIRQGDKAFDQVGAGEPTNYNRQNPDNIGNLKSESYLEAMFRVYQQCWSVLKIGGLMILVVKPFIRDQKLVPLQEDTKQICYQAGFSFIEEHHRILPSQSFWRVIYQKRYPFAPVIDKEYVLVIALQQQQT